MSSNRTFIIAFLISLTIHILAIFSSLGFNISINKKARNRMEVSYINKANTVKPKDALKLGNSRIEPFLKLPDNITAKQINPPPFIESSKDISNSYPKETIPQEMIKPVLIKPDIYSAKKKITLPAINIDKINNPSYVSYYQIVREKIRRSAYKNYIRNETGDVYITFIISNDGYLKNLRLVEDKSSTSIYLRASALASVKDASPFPNFPKELDYPYLTFNVIISFEIE